MTIELLKHVLQNQKKSFLQIKTCLLPIQTNLRKELKCRTSTINNYIDISQRPTVSQDVLSACDESMILPCLTYCNLVWGSSYKTNLKKKWNFEKLCNKNSERVILYSPGLKYSIT